MKFLLLIVAIIMTNGAVTAQLKTTPVCPPFAVDVLEGTVNKIYPVSTLGEIKKELPCFTDIVEQGTDTKCAGIFYKDKDIYFYTDRNYIEVGENFKGTLSVPLLGASRSSLFKLLGNPKIKDVSWDAFQMQYGILILYYNKADKIIKLQISSKNTETIKLCE